MALFDLKKGDKEFKEKPAPHELINPTQLDQIRRDLIETNADLVIRGMLEKDVRKRLKSIVRKQHSAATNGNEDVVDYIVQETIGVGVIEEILKDESITDIGYNGKELIIESNDNKYVFDTNFEVTEDYIVRLVSKFATSNQKEFTNKQPIFDGLFENIRINAVHSQNTAPESGTTMALRVVRPRLALTEDNFDGFAPRFMLDFFEAAAKARANMVISGSTGTGKTELHKLISRYIPFEDRILLIEDTPETFMKEMFPDKDVYSWVTSHDVGVTKLIKAGLRNNPSWIMVTETRGDEAYEMIQAVLSGHSIITSLHATNARAIPTRLVNMAKMGYELSEEALIEDISRYFQFGVHIKKTRYKGMVIRYLSELIEFDLDGHKTIFKQRFIGGKFYHETFELTEDFKYMLEEADVHLDFPENDKGERSLNSENVTFETTIPLDETGRPDFELMKASGADIDDLFGKDERAELQRKTDEERLAKLKAKINATVDNRPEDKSKRAKPPEDWDPSEDEDIL